MKRSDSIAALAAALAKAQAKIKPAEKDSDNPFFKSKYADLASVQTACREHLAANGLCVIQLPRTVAEGVEVETMLAHASGEWIAETLTLPVNKKDCQGVGSAITYARRYGLASIVGVAPDDDDGNAGSRGVHAERQEEPRQAAKPANGTQKPVQKADPPLLTPEEQAKVEMLDNYLPTVNVAAGINSAILECEALPQGALRSTMLPKILARSKELGLHWDKNNRVFYLPNPQPAAF